MYALRQSTRRKLCRAAFLTACLLPLGALVVLGAYRRTPSHVRDCEAALGHALGLRVDVGSVEHPRPGIARYFDVALGDAETGRPLARCEHIEVRTPPLGGATECLVYGITLRQEDLSACYAIVERLLRHEHGIQSDEILLSLEDIVLLSGSAEQAIERVDGSIEVDATHGDARFDVLPAPGEADAEGGEETARRVALQIVRDRRLPTPATEIAWQTGAVGVRWAWLAAVYDQLPALNGARFIGSIRAAEHDGEWQVAIEGSLKHVDLADAVTRPFGYSATGDIAMEIERAQFQDGKLVALKAQLSGGPGRVSSTLLDAAATALGCGAQPREAVATQSVPYTALDFGVTIDQGLTIVGRCRDATGAMLIGANRQPLLVEPKQQPISTLALVRMMGGAGGQNVPATRQAALMLKWLPLPAAQSAAKRPASATNPSAGSKN